MILVHDFIKLSSGHSKGVPVPVSCGPPMLNCLFFSFTTFGTFSGWFLASLRSNVVLTHNCLCKGGAVGCSAYSMPYAMPRTKGR